jgi:hypothetical protein
MEDFQLIGLEKLLNSDTITKTYPMVDHIDIRMDEDFITPRGNRRLDVDIFLNDPTITEKNMYDYDFDPHYLVEYHIKNYARYLGIENKYVINFIVWGPDGDIIHSWKD